MWSIPRKGIDSQVYLTFRDLENQYKKERHVFCYFAGFNLKGLVELTILETVYKSSCGSCFLTIRFLESD